MGQIQFGTREPITYVDSAYGEIGIMANGIVMTFDRAEDSNELYKVTIKGS